ncbi:MAG: hypothetical protein ACI4IL_07145 [Eubacterium sp.]
MGKSKRELQEMANTISSETGQYLLTKIDICKITGLSKPTVNKLCSNITPASTGKRKLYYIKDVLDKLYNG